MGLGPKGRLNDKEESMELGNIDFIQIFRSSFTLVILLVCSILAVAFTVERFLFYRPLFRVSGPRNSPRIHFRVLMAISGGLPPRPHIPLQVFCDCGLHARAL